MVTVQSGPSATKSGMPVTTANAARSRFQPIDIVAHQVGHIDRVNVAKVPAARVDRAIQRLGWAADQRTARMLTLGLSWQAS